MTIFRDDRDHFEPSPAPLHPDRLAAGGAIDVQIRHHVDRLYTWFKVFWFAILTLIMLAVIYGFVAITP